MQAHTHNLGKHGTSGVGYGHPDGGSNVSSGDFISQSTGGGNSENLQPYGVYTYLVKT